MMTLTPIETFVIGFCGSLAVEVVTVINIFQREPIACPERYKKPLFWVARLSLAAVGGGLAVAYDISTPLLAANVGASAATPLPEGRILRIKGDPEALPLIERVLAKDPDNVDALFEKALVLAARKPRGPHRESRKNGRRHR